VTALLPPSRLAPLLGVSAATVRKKFRAGEWPSMWAGGQWVGDPDEIRAHMRREAERRRGVEPEPEPVRLQTADDWCRHAGCWNGLTKAPRAHCRGRAS
jgi:hypothetical protein